MEALGQLTGGIAHDFNNMLGVIIGYTELAIDSINKDRDIKLSDYLSHIEQASSRAKKLILQMMVFSRSDKRESTAIELKPLIEENIKMLRSVIPSSITINSNLADNVPKVLMDSIQFQQIIMNLSINAKDAITNSGIIDIRLECAKNYQTECLACHKTIDGDWIELSFTDTGMGMHADVMEHIFEPFFTTKEVGKGTGMGMSVLSSIVENHNGHILIESELNKGTSIKLLFPPAIENTEQIEKHQKQPVSAITDGAEKKILIIDDEPALANYLSEMLENFNFNCFVQTDSLRALSLFKAQADDFDAVISDQTMPGINGVELIEKMREIRPDLPAILATGYSDTINKAKAEEKNIIFIEKPIAKNTLINNLNKLLFE